RSLEGVARRIAASRERFARVGRRSRQRFVAGHYRSSREEIGGGTCPRAFLWAERSGKDSSQRGGRVPGQSYGQGVSCGARFWKRRERGGGVVTTDPKSFGLHGFEEGSDRECGPGVRWHAHECCSSGGDGSGGCAHRADEGRGGHREEDAKPETVQSKMQGRG